VANAPHVNVDEVRARVITHASTLQAHRRTPQNGKVAARQADVHSLSLEVETVLGHALTAGVQDSVRFRRSVSRDHVEGASMTEVRPEDVHQIQESGVDHLDLTRPVIPQDMVDVGQGPREVSSFGAVDHPEVLIGVGIMKGEGPFGCQGISNRCESSKGHGR